MDFKGSMSSLQLENAATDAFIGSRDMVWQDVLRLARNKVRGSSRRTEEAKQAGLLFISQIVSREAATLSRDEIAKRTHKYLFEERLKAKLCTVYEDLFPFIWSCPWTALAFRQHAAQLNKMLSPLLGRGTSVLLRSTPIAVVVEIFHAVQKKGANTISWWLDEKKENERYLVDAGVRFMGGMQGKELSEEDTKKVEGVVWLLVAFFKHNAFLLEGKSKFSDLCSIDTDMGAYYARRTVRADSKDIDFFYLEREEFCEAVKRVGQVCDDMLADCVILMKLRSAVITGCSKEQAATVGCLCYEEDGVPLYSLDHLWMDLSRMIADLSRGWESVNNIYHKECVLNYMDYMKHPRAVPGMTKVSYRKLFMLAMSLSQGFSTADIDISDLVSPIVSRVTKEGNQVRGRKRRAPICKREQKRVKRAMDESDDSSSSSSEDDGRLDVVVDSDEELSDRHSHRGSNRSARDADVVLSDAEEGEAEGDNAVGDDAVGDDAVGDDAVGDDAVGDDAEGVDAEGVDAEGDDAEGDDAEGVDAEGDDAEGDDAEGDDAEGDDAEGDDAEDDDAESDYSCEEGETGGNHDVVDGIQHGLEIGPDGPRDDESESSSGRNNRRPAQKGRNKRNSRPSRSSTRHPTEPPRPHTPPRPTPSQAPPRQTPSRQTPPRQTPRQTSRQTSRQTAPRPTTRTTRRVTLRSKK